jgi:hypothetical protein
VIFFKKKKIIIDCFVSNEHIANLFPISKTVDFLPAWWKSMPKTVPSNGFPVEMSTIKRCPGFKDLFTKSVCIPAWSEYKLFQDPNFGFSHVAPNSTAAGNQHNSAQMEGAFPNYQHYKLHSPWFLKESSGIYFTMVQASWHTQDPCNYHIPTGCLEFKYQHSTHINFIAQKNETILERTIDAGTPLVYLVPLSDKEIDLNIQVVSDQEISKLKTYHHSFYNSYEITKKIRKEKHE